MTSMQAIAKNFREVYFGGNWTAVNLKQVLEDVNLEMATTQVLEMNTIAILVNHMHYYVVEVTKVLKGAPLLAKDELSFTHPHFEKDEDWEKFLGEIWIEAEDFARLVEALSDDLLFKEFDIAKYGNYYRNIQGIVEHFHYHLGQIVLLKKLLKE